MARDQGALRALGSQSTGEEYVETRPGLCDLPTDPPTVCRPLSAPPAVGVSASLVSTRLPQLLASLAPPHPTSPVCF